MQLENGLLFFKSESTTFYIRTKIVCPSQPTAFATSPETCRKKIMICHFLINGCTLFMSVCALGSGPIDSGKGCLHRDWFGIYCHVCIFRIWCLILIVFRVVFISICFYSMGHELSNLYIQAITPRFTTFLAKEILRWSKDNPQFL